ncbi:unnamed protein product [Nezara viridula]|uniref:Uncharacterized protein n=1 Tax=Nezara viridula TaxID=85310 RepID=A0A9P0GYW6_NEZVI|nr:unnamed protein product [Nezara viridula]
MILFSVLTGRGIARAGEASLRDLQTPTRPPLSIGFCAVIPTRPSSHRTCAPQRGGAPIQNCQATRSRSSAFIEFIGFLFFSPILEMWSIHMKLDLPRGGVR